MIWRPAWAFMVPPQRSFVAPSAGRYARLGRRDAEFVRERPAGAPHGVPVSQAPPALTTEHLDKLARAFVVAPALDATLPMMLKVLKGHRSAAVDESAVAAADTVLEWNHPPYGAADLVALTLRRFGNSPPLQDTKQLGGNQDLIDRDPLLGGPSFDGPNLRARWARVRKQIPFAHRALALAPNAGVRRPGATTPP